MTNVFRPTADEADSAREQSVTDPTDLKFVGRATAAAITDAGFDAADLTAKRVSYRMLVDAGVNPGVAAKIRRWHSLQWSFESGEGLDQRSEQIRGLQADERDWVASSYGDEGATRDEEESEDDTENTSDTEWSDSIPQTEPEPASPGDDDPRQAEADWVAASRGDGDGGTDGDDQFVAEASWVAGSQRDESPEGATTDGSGDPVAAEAAWRERSKPTPVTDLDGVDDETASKLAAAGVRSVRSLATADPELLADVTGLAAPRVEAWFEAARERHD